MIHLSYSLILLNYPISKLIAINNQNISHITYFIDVMICSTLQNPAFLLLYTTIDHAQREEEQNNV